MKMKQQFKGSAALVLATLIWGSTFVAQSVGMDYIGPFTFQAVRCGLAALGLLPVILLFDKSFSAFCRGWKDKRLWKAGILCGIPLFLACNLQQLGLVDTDAGKSAVLPAMYIVIVPVLGIFLKQKPSIMVPISVALAVAGLYCLSCVGVTAISQGDLLLIACAVMFAVQILCVDHFAADTDPLRMNAIQAAVCAVLSGVVMLFTETPKMDALLDCWFPLAYAGFLSMGAAYTLQIVGQKHIEPAAASLIMSLESVFAVVFGCLLLKETMTGWEITGCVLMFLAVVLSQIPVPAKTKKA